MSQAHWGVPRPPEASTPEGDYSQASYPPFSKNIKGHTHPCDLRAGKGRGMGCHTRSSIPEVSWPRLSAATCHSP